MIRHDSTYILAQGEKASERLIKQQKIIGPDSVTLLDKAGLSPGMRVLEIGCGVGLMSTLIAARIGLSGTLTAVDISNDQLKLAKSFCHNRNIEFVQHNILDNNPDWLDTFDFVYARLVLGHVTDPRLALNHMVSYLKPGGIISVEETRHESGMSEPPSLVVDTVYELLRRWQEHHGQRQQGPALLDHFTALGLHNIQAEIAKPPLDTTEKRQLLLQSLLESKSKFLELGLITNHDMDALITDLHDFCQQDGYRNYLHMHQIFATRSPSS